MSLVWLNIMMTIGVFSPNALINLCPEGGFLGCMGDASLERSQGMGGTAGFRGYEED